MENFRASKLYMWVCTHSLFAAMNCTPDHDHFSRASIQFPWYVSKAFPGFVPSVLALAFVWWQLLLQMYQYSIAREGWTGKVYACSSAQSLRPAWCLPQMNKVRGFIYVPPCLSAVLILWSIFFSPSCCLHDFMTVARETTRARQASATSYELTKLHAAARPSLARVYLLVNMKTYTRACTYYIIKIVNMWSSKETEINERKLIPQNNFFSVHFWAMNPDPPDIRKDEACVAYIERVCVYMLMMPRRCAS